MRGASTLSDDCAATLQALFGKRRPTIVPPTPYETAKASPGAAASLEWMTLASLLSERLLGRCGLAPRPNSNRSVTMFSYLTSRDR